VLHQIDLSITTPTQILGKITGADRGAAEGAGHGARDAAAGARPGRGARARRAREQGSRVGEEEGEGEEREKREGEGKKSPPGIQIPAITTPNPRAPRGERWKRERLLRWKSK
jgi:hypothetical protein